VGIDPAMQARAPIGVERDPCVVTGRDDPGAEVLGQGQELAQLDRSVAGHARARGGAGQVSIDEGRHDLALEELASIERVMGDAEVIGDQARVVTPITSSPSSTRRAAATAESTPPDIATSTRSAMRRA
jgi:hypothetical protein